MARSVSKGSLSIIHKAVGRTHLQAEKHFFSNVLRIGEVFIRMPVSYPSDRVVDHDLQLLMKQG
jgi:hypothetical protein